MASKCSKCGKEIYNAKGFCPYCGECISDEFNRQFSCPICNNRLDYDSDFCGNCGFKITKDLNYVIRESNSKTCLHCKNKNNMDAEFCGNCGESLPLVSYLNLVECQECKSLVREDVNFCRFCGHDFNKGKKSLFAKRPKSHIRFCENCGNKIPDASKTKFCNTCGTRVPINNVGYAGTLFPYEDYQLRLVNKFIYLLSKEYGVNFRKITLSEYFDVDYFQELHIFYLMMKQIKNGDTEDIIGDFKVILDETKKNQENIGEAIVNQVKKNIRDSFYGDGLSTSEVRTITGDYYETIETPIVQNKHGGIAKGAATLGFGLVGLAATSGVKQTTSTRQVLNKGSYFHSNVTISDNYIVLKTYTDDSSSVIFDSNKGNVVKSIFYWKDIELLDHEGYIILNNGETFKLPKFVLKNRIKNAIELVLNTGWTEIDSKFENEYYNEVYLKVVDLIPNLIKETIEKNKEKEMSNHQNKDNLNEENTFDKNMVKCPNCGKLNDGTNKFCGECGSKLELIANYCPNCDKTYDSGEKFCTECGNKLTIKSN